VTKRRRKTVSMPMTMPTMSGVLEREEVGIGVGILEEEVGGEPAASEEGMPSLHADVRYVSRTSRNQTYGVETEMLSSPFTGFGLDGGWLVSELLKNERGNAE
jgi:hypothetical protein